MSGQEVLGPATAGATAINPLVGTAIGVGGQLLNTMFQGISNRRQNKRMVDFWKMNNEYNHPSAQMQRLREAGLNPALMYGQSAAGAAGNSGSPPDPIPETTVDIGNPLAQYQNLKMFKLQSDNLRAQNTQILNDAALKAVNAVKSGAEANLTKGKLDVLERTANDLVLQAGHKSALMLSQVGESHNRQLLQEKQLQKIAQDITIGAEKLSNEQKLGRLRDAELKLKKLNLDFYESKAYMSLLTQLLGIKLFK